MSFASVRSATSRRVIAGPSSRRLLSTSGPVAAAKANKANSLAEANPNAMSVKEAVRVLRALEIANPSSAYSLEIRTKVKRGQTLRGRAALPTDPRRVTDTIVVFAPTDSPSAEAAKEAGANYVGDVDLFPKILSGEIVPTKVLSTPSMLPAVSKSLARFLGPKGLMPVTKRGTVGEGQELGRLIKAAGGTLDWKTDKEGYIRAPVARATFTPEMVEVNIRSFIASVREAAHAESSSENSTSRTKQSSSLSMARLETTHGPSIEVYDVLQ